MDGVLLIDKPAGMTSHDVVAAVRRALGGAQDGHAGTLDPFATGLLLVLVGRATKSQRALMALPKRYETVARLGAARAPATPRARSPRPAACRADPPTLPTARSASARRPTRRSRSAASAPTRARAAARRSRCPSGRHGPPLRAAVARATPSPDARAIAIECSLGHLRALADRRPRRRLLRGARRTGDRPVRRSHDAVAPPAARRTTLAGAHGRRSSWRRSSRAR